MAKQSNKKKNIPQSAQNAKDKKNSLTFGQIFKRADTLLYTFLTFAGIAVAVFLPRLLNLEGELGGTLLLLAGVLTVAFCARKVSEIINKYLKK